MHLTPRDEDRLTIFVAAELARKRRARGLRLNVPEATAVITDTFCEAARDGATLAEAKEAAQSVLSAEEVLDGVAAILEGLEVEAAFDDGSRLAILPTPVAGQTADHDAPGAVLVGAGRPAASDSASATTIEVTNEAEVLIGVTSHWHFFEANRRLRFDRAAAFGMRLDMPAGSSVRFEPGARTEVSLVPIAGERIVIGFAGLVNGPLDRPGMREAALERARELGYAGA